MSVIYNLRSGSMPGEQPMDRRSALRLVALAATTPLLRGLSANELLAFGQGAHARAALGPSLQTLSGRRHSILLAAIDRILPETDTPGAVGAEVDRFIDVMLADWYSIEERERLLAGLDELDRSSRWRYEKPFTECIAAEQVELLESNDREHYDDSTHWFGMLKYLTIWGFFTSEVGMTLELGKHTRQGMWKGCAPLPGSGEGR